MNWKRDGLVIWRPIKALIKVVNNVHTWRAMRSRNVGVIVFYAGSKGKPTIALSK